MKKTIWMKVAVIFVISMLMSLFANVSWVAVAEETEDMTVTSDEDESPEFTGEILTLGSELMSGSGFTGEIPSDGIISSDGTYTLPAGFAGEITIKSTANSVTIIGDGPDNQHAGTYITVEGTRTGKLVLTIENLNIAAPTGKAGIDFGSADGPFTHELYLSGSSIIKGGDNCPEIHVPEGISLKIGSSSDGSLEVTGGMYGAGKGGGKDGSGGIIEITGGTVKATGGADGAGIGGGESGSGGSITISENAKVEAKGGSTAAGTGGSGNGGGIGSFGTITITGGKVIATGGAGEKNTFGGSGGGAGIGGGGNGGAGGSVTISGNVEVTATGGNGQGTTTNGGGAGIGSGGSSEDCIITISDSAEVTATGGESGAGIGGGSSGAGGTITISDDASVEATGGERGAGIGGGNAGNGGTITISGNVYVTTAGGENGAGIGGGSSGAGGTVIVIGYPTVIATVGTSACDIGNGSGGTGETYIKRDDNSGQDLTYIRIEIKNMLSGTGNKVSFSGNEHKINSEGLTGFFVERATENMDITLTLAGFGAVDTSISPGMSKMQDILLMTM